MEIERKFIVNDLPEFITKEPGYRIIQAYINSHNPTIRLRIVNDKEAYLTIKSPPLDLEGRVRNEYEYAIDVKEAEEMIDIFCDKVLEKTRYIYYADDHNNWEIDVFEGRLKGLILAELELKSVDQEFKKPNWIGEEVTSDPNYTNACLINHS